MRLRRTQPTCACGCGYLVAPNAEPRVRFVRGHQRLRYPIDGGPLIRCKSDANGCLNFPGEGARPMVRYHGRWVLAYRLAWEERFGPAPDGMEVCHTCDNGNCCALDHLFLGTHTDNMRDMVAKDRWGNQTRRVA